MKGVSRNTAQIRDETAAKVELALAGRGRSSGGAVLAPPVGRPRFEPLCHINKVWWPTAVILALRKWRWEGQKFKAIQTAQDKP